MQSEDVPRSSNKTSYFLVLTRNLVKLKIYLSFQNSYSSKFRTDSWWRGGRSRTFKITRRGSRTFRVTWHAQRQRGNPAVGQVEVRRRVLASLVASQPGFVGCEEVKRGQILARGQRSVRGHDRVTRGQTAAVVAKQRQAPAHVQAAEQGLELLVWK